MENEKWESQFRKGLMELAVMAAVESKPRYGLDILEAVRASGLKLSEGTLYPLLGRLYKENKLAAEWIEDKDASHPRKYYRLTKEGKTQLALMKQSWLEYSRIVNRLLKEVAYAS
jgi:PadR family transcriptional regulator PadR